MDYSISKDRRKRIILTLLCCVCLIFSAASSFANPRKITVQIKGVKGDILNNVHQRLYIKAKNLTNEMNPKTVATFIKMAPKEISGATAPYGYFQPHIMTQKTFKANTWNIIFNIKLGPAVHIKKVNLNIIGAGANTKPYIRYKKTLTLKPGQTFNSDEYKAVKNGLFDLAAEYGYFKAKMLHSEARIILEQHSAIINIKFATGPRYQFGKTIFSPSYISKKLLERYPTYKPNDQYRNSKIQTLQKNLSDSGYFTLSNTATRFNEAKNNKVPIEVSLTDAKRYRYIFGGGYGTDTGLRAIVGVKVRAVNRWGHKFNAETQVSMHRNFISTDYIIPGGQPGTQFWDLHNVAGAEDFDYIGSVKLLRTGISYQRDIRSWTQILDLSGLFENYKLKNYPSSNTVTILPSILWKKRHVRPNIAPTHGYNISAQVSGAPISIFGYDRFLQTNINFKTLNTIGEDTRIILRSNLVLTFINHLTQLPLSLRPMAGGSQSIRGYDYKSIYKGKDMLVSSIELQERIWGSLYLAGFYDAGTVSDKLNGIFYQGVGPGIVWLTKIGAIELTVAKPLNLGPKASWKVQFSIGPEL